MALQLDPTPLIVVLAAIGITAMLLTTAAAIRQGVSIIELERRIEALQESQRQQLIAKGFISDDPAGLIEVAAADAAAPARDERNAPLEAEQVFKRHHVSPAQ